jgi:hypothetical protein
LTELKDCFNQILNFEEKTKEEQKLKFEMNPKKIYKSSGSLLEEIKRGLKRYWKGEPLG